MNTSGAVFCAKTLIKQGLKGREVLDVGSRTVDTSLRPVIDALKPLKYTGVDMIEGENVDVVCSAEDVLDKFGPEAFDVVISSEMVEHVRDWKKVISNLKNLVKRNGLLLVTTRSIGFPFHGFPHDYWRYEKEDFERIFSDFEIIDLETDPLNPGVFIMARKPEDFEEKDLSDYKLYALPHKGRVGEMEESRIKKFINYRLFLEKVKKFALGVAQKVFGKL